jgi:choline kinase
MHQTEQNEQITTALLLAAGIGHRLQPLTDNMPKCLTKVNDKEILAHLIYSLQLYNFRRLIVVVGYLEQSIRKFLDKIAGSITVEYIVSPKYRTTNNIYSLWMARNKIQSPFLLFESDLVFAPSLLKNMLYPGRIAVSHILPWMNGTTITTDLDIPHNVTAFNLNSLSAKTHEMTYKTVNIYSFSRQTWKRVAKRLDHFISAGRINDYYETVFAEMIADGSLNFQSVLFAKERWYEIDTVEDLHACERMFLNQRLPKIKQKVTP